jgi:hypothetical protein
MANKNEAFPAHIRSVVFMEFLFIFYFIKCNVLILKLFKVGSILSTEGFSRLKAKLHSFQPFRVYYRWISFKILALTSEFFVLRCWMNKCYFYFEKHTTYNMKPITI